MNNKDPLIIRFLWIIMIFAALGASLISIECFFLLWLWAFTFIVLFDKSLRERRCKNGEKRTDSNFDRRNSSETKGEIRFAPNQSE